MVKYLVYGGYVYSKEDGQRHYVSAVEVARLHGVKLSECYLINDSREMVGSLRKGLTVLMPKSDGNYPPYEQAA